MLLENYHKFLKFFITRCHAFAKKIWFPPMLTVLSLLDVFLIFIPADGIMISSSMIIPKQWRKFALHVAIGSSLGALLLIALVENFGLEQINLLFPNIDKSEIWIWTKHFFHNYGIIVLFIVGLAPFSQQPVLILSALSDHSFLLMGVAIFLSRIIKFSLMAYIATHAPQMIEKFWGLKTELKDAGIKID